jgi:hypothetical protein
MKHSNSRQSMHKARARGATQHTIPADRSNLTKRMNNKIVSRCSCPGSYLPWGSPKKVLTGPMMHDINMTQYVTRTHTSAYLTVPRIIPGMGSTVQYLTIDRLCVFKVSVIISDMSDAGDTCGRTTPRTPLATCTTSATLATTAMSLAKRRPQSWSP